jgi:FdhD protein
VINVRLRNPASLDVKRLTRHVFSSSSCGICSKASIDAVRQQYPPIEDDFQVEPQVLLGLPAALASAQETFKRTGGLHACALFDTAGELLVLREGVGRHNALDKVVGWALLGTDCPSPTYPAAQWPCFIRDDAKALAAGIPIVAAISAPSSLAVEFARDSRQTLVGSCAAKR